MSANTDKHLDELTELRHELHSIAELSGEEGQTAEKIRRYLETANPDEIIDQIGGNGIVARYKGREEGPAVLIRCELDALPIPDGNDLEYRSQHPEAGHKCGHDGHMAIVCGVARALKDRQVQKGEVLLLFQPAEETGEGAAGVIKDKRFAALNPDYVFALHNLPGFRQNQIIIKEGAFAAASVGLIVRLRGATSHAAHPEQGRSPALATAQLIESLSALPQFHTPLELAAKVTVVHARLGEQAFGTSPGYAEVMATLRTYSDEALDVLKQKAEATAVRLAHTYDLEPETEWVEAFPATHNDEEAVSLLRQVAEEQEREILEKAEPFGWSEDFGHFTRKYKGALFGLGAGRQQPALHAPDYDFPDRLIPAGVSMFMGIIERLTG